MNGDTVLDFVELELTSSSTRFDLFVSADNVREKLASGFVKPFLTHLRAVEEQVAQGSNSVRLEHPHPRYQGRSWFTKGTFERFVQFVSTPEVLERVKSVEDELTQLEQVRNIQASSLHQTENLFVGADSAASKADACVLFDGLKRNGSSKLPRRYQDDVAENGAEASKIELLRAMDLRLLALKQEQSVAFGRAAAAGFNHRNMADLIGFSDHFGAERFRTACMNFLAVLKARSTQSTQLELEAVPSCNVTTAHDRGTDVREAGRCQYQDDDTHVSSLTTSRGSRGTEVRKRWGPLENIRTNLYINQNETDSNSSNGMSNGVLSVSGSPEVQSSLKESALTDIEEEIRGRDVIIASIVPETSLNFSQGKNSPKAALRGRNNPFLRQSLETNVDCNGGLSERRSSLPPTKASIGSSLSTQGERAFSLQGPLVENSIAAGKLRVRVESESPKLEEDDVGSEVSSTPVVASARRLSVQDAISLFENKQRRNSMGSLGKHRPAKQENSRESSKGCPSPGNSVLKRRNSGEGLEACVVLTEYQLSSSKPEAADFCPVRATEGESTASSASLDFTGLSQQGHGSSVAQMLSGSSIDKQTLVANVSARVEAGTDQNPTDYRVYASSEGFKDGLLAGDWKKQFKLQLEKSLVKESSLTSNLPVETAIQRSKTGPFFPESVINPLVCDQPTYQKHLLVGSRSKEALDKDNILVDQKQALPRQDTLGSTSLLLPTTVEVNAEQINLSLKNLEAMDNRKECESDDIAKHLGSSLVKVPSNHDYMQSLVTLADHQQTTEGDKHPDGLKGRFYEQYRKLRDAKLLEDQDSKRAEREAKLKEMEETLTKRKAEMDARSSRLSKVGTNQTRATKVEAFKADLQTPKKEQAIISSASPFLTPHTSKDVASISKAQAGMKKAAAASAPQKGATPPRSSSKPTPSVSPKLAPRSTMAAGNLRKSVGSSYTTDNPLARSVPCFANLRKENTKPSPGRALGSARVHPKNGASGLVPGINEVSPLEANANVSVRARNGPIPTNKEDPKGRSTLVRKSCATGSDFKTLSLSSDDGVLAPIKGQREMKPECAAYNRLRRSAVGTLQEAKPFLRKGRSIGPGTGPGLVKQKVPSASADAAKSPDEETATLHMPGPDCSERTCPIQDAVLHESNCEELSEVENMDMEGDAPVYFAAVNCSEGQAIDRAETTMCESNEEATMDSSVAVDVSTEEPLPDMERAFHTISFPIDVKTHDRYAMEFSTQKDMDSLLEADTVSLKEQDSEADTVSLKERDSETVSSHKEHLIESSESQIDEVSTSICASSLPHGHGMLPVFASTSSSPLASHVAQYDHSGPSAVKLDLPPGSPASWNSSHLQYTDVSQLTKKWVACQKPIITTQVSKDPVRGFKRLLKFGRKSRTSELAVSDCVSASTTSEGDDESEDHGRFADEVSSSRGMLQERRYIGVPVNQWKAEEEASALNLRSSIPTPPADFRLRDDHMSGGTMLKAPRSFFSLSSFRSKGSEMKSR